MESETTILYPVRERCLAVLDNMKHHYGKGIKTRAADKKHAYYLAPHGAKDPIARLITQIEIEAILDWLADPHNFGTNVNAFYSKNRERFPSLHQYPDKFLIEIQDWHDNDTHWDDKGVNEDGWNALAALREKVATKMMK